MTETTKKILRYSIAIVIVVLSVWGTIVGVDLNKMWQYIISANYLWVIATIPVALLSHWVRAMRWKTMLEPVHKANSTWNLFSAVMVGYAFNNILPRGGEIIRPMVYSRREKVSFSTLFATIMLERVMDLLILLFLFGCVFFLFQNQIQQALPNLAVEKIIAPTLIVVAVLVLSFWPPFFRFVLKLTIKPISVKFYEKILSLFDKFTKGFAILKKPSQYFRLTVESLSIWLFYTIPMYLVFFSFPFQAVHHLGFDDAILLIVISGIGFTVAPSPGALGVYHFLIQNALVNLYHVSPEEALAYATVTHGVNYIVQVVVGGVFALRENIKSIPGKSVSVELPETQ